MSLTFDDIVKRAQEGKPLVNPGELPPPKSSTGAALDLGPLLDRLDVLLQFQERQTVAFEIIAMFCANLQKERNEVLKAELEAKAAEEAKAKAEQEAAELERLTAPTPLREVTG